MRIIDILNQPWAIDPAKLEQIQDIYRAHIAGPKIDIEAIEARMGAPLQRREQGYSVDRGVATVPVDGVIARRMNLMSQISGGASTELIGRDLRAAAADPDVGSIVLEVSSPGGTVDGTQELAGLVREIGQAKPVVAMVSGTAASAAYWIASAADSIYATESTAQIGSIGVIGKHIDRSAADASAGLKVTEFTAGRYKNAGSPHAPLTDESRATLQAQVDAIYSLFVDDVAANRGTTSERVLADMADGRVFLARDAVSRGLIDGVMPRDELISQMAMGRLPLKRRASAGVPALAATGAGDAPNLNSAQETTMEITVDMIRAEHPDVAEALRAEERNRILGIEQAALPGHDALVAEMKADGKTTPGEAALRINAAEREARAKTLAAIQSQAPEPVKASAAPADKPLTKDEKAAQAQAHAAKHGTDFLTAYKQLFAA